MSAFGEIRKRLMSELLASLKLIPVIVFGGMALGTLANMTSPRGIGWTYDWSVHVEAQAYAENFPVASYESMRDFVESGTAMIVDARPLANYSDGHIPTALLLSAHSGDDPLGTFGILERGDQVVVYCGNSQCDDALIIGRRLRLAGVDDVSVYVGGWDEWRRRGGGE